MDKKINSFAREILQVMHKYGKPMTIAQISQKTGMSWNTVEKYLDELSNEDFVYYDFRGSKTYWKLNY